MILAYYIYIAWLVLVKSNIYHSSNLTIPMIGMLVFIIIYINDIIKLPKIILIFSFIHIGYFIVFEINDFESFKYLSARVTFLIFFSILIRRSSYQTIVNITKKNAMICLTLLTLSIFINNPDIGSRYSGIFSNPNELGAMALYCAAIMNSSLFKNRITKNISFLLSIIMVILSGSRVALAGLLIILISSSGKNLFKSTFKIFLIILPLFSYVYISIIRIFSGNIFEGRLLNWYVTYNSILQKVYIGHGLKSYEGITDDSVYTEATAKWAMASAHSGYLTYFLMFGIPLGSLVILILIYPFIKSLVSKNNKSSGHLYYCMQIITGLWLLYSVVESSFTGVNDLEVIFYFSSWIILIHFVFGYMTQKIINHNHHIIKNI